MCSLEEPEPDLAKEGKQKSLCGKPAKSVPSPSPPASRVDLLEGQAPEGCQAAQLGLRKGREDGRRDDNGHRPRAENNSEPRSVEVLQRALDQREAVLQAVPPALQAISPARHSQQTHLEDPLSRDRTPHQPKQPWPQPNDPSDHQTAPQTVRLYPEVYTDHDSPHRSSVDIDQHLSERLQFGDRRCHYIDKPRLICFPPIPSLVSKQGV